MLSIVRRSARPLLTGGLGMATGFGLAAFYILPAAWEQRWVQITRPSPIRCVPNETFFSRAWRSGICFFNWKVSAVALVVILAVAIAAVFVSRRRRENPGSVVGASRARRCRKFLMFPASAIFWRLLPKLQFLQFPWRWLGPLDFVSRSFLPQPSEA